MNNFALLDKELERERFKFYFETFGCLLEIKCGTWNKVLVCASDTREEIVCECGHAFTLKREARITASSAVNESQWKIHCGDRKRTGHVWQA